MRMVIKTGKLLKSLMTHAATRSFSGINAARLVLCALRCLQWDLLMMSSLTKPSQEHTHSIRSNLPSRHLHVQCVRSKTGTRDAKQSATNKFQTTFGIDCRDSWTLVLKLFSKVNSAKRTQSARPHATLMETSAKSHGMTHQMLCSSVSQ